MSILSLRDKIKGSWVVLCRRTNDPKLSWLEHQLKKANILHRRNGESFHAPILEVWSSQLDEAWNILDPIDDIEDDDPMFSGPTEKRRISDE